MNTLLKGFPILFLMVLTSVTIFAQDEGEVPFDPLFGDPLNDNGQPITRDYDDHGDTYADFYIPGDTPYSAINFKLKGGAGGSAKAGSSCNSDGGAGATTEILAIIGDEEGMLPRGCYLRFIIGEAGVSGSTGSIGNAVGGGGGGTAILYNLEGGDDEWEILAVAGGGGGAYQGAFFGGCIDSQNGQGGRSTTEGGDGDDTFGGSGGEDGQGGNGGGINFDLAGGGGGAFGGGGGVGSSEGGRGFPTGGNGGSGTEDSEGGWGFGGGGSGDDAGAGGGGYSGGGGGGIGNNGGGGGSYVNEDRAITLVITAGGTDASMLDGEITYEFTSVCRAAFDGFDYINPLCSPEDRGRLQLNYFAIGSAGCSRDNLDFSLTPVNGWRHLGDGVIRSLRAGNYTVHARNLELDAIVSTYQITIGVTDEVPTALCNDITVDLDDTGNYSNPNLVNLIDQGSSGPCNPVLSVDRTTFDCTDVGPNTVTLSVAGSHGLTGTCQSTVTVREGANPVITARCKPDKTIELSNGTVTLTDEDVNAGSTIGACPVTGTITPSTFDCNDVGTNTVIYSISRGTTVRGCSMNITITDSNQPTANCRPNYELLLAGNGTATLNPTVLNNGSLSNNCTSLSFSADITSFDCDDIGPNTVTLSVTDGYNRTSSCETTVTIVEVTSPIAQCQDISVALDEHGNAAITAALIDNGSNAGCSTTLSSSVLSFDCADLGEQIVTLTATSVLGQQATCQAIVTVIDTIPPSAFCQDFTFTDIPASLFAFRPFLFSNAEDNCGVSSFQFLDNPTFDCEDIGTQEVQLEVTDGSGNRDTCGITVTIDYELEEVVTGCDGENYTIELEDDGSYTLTEQDLFSYLGASLGLTCRNFSDLSPYASQTVFTCANVGEAVPVTFSLTEPGEAPSTCVANIIVEDNTNPVCSTAPQVAIKAFLAGAYEAATGLMRDDLGWLGLVPTNSPYGNSDETTSNLVLAKSGPDAIVDWVELEIRIAADPTQVLHTQSALLQ
ncbi:MAG: hypothetical protein AAGA31_02870, partial [Bacteroidota bacterium]